MSVDHRRLLPFLRIGGGRETLRCDDSHAGIRKLECSVVKALWCKGGKEGVGMGGEVNRASRAAWLVQFASINVRRLTNERVPTSVENIE